MKRFTDNVLTGEPQRKWDQRYMEIADLVATWSKDPITKVGAYAVGEYGQPLSHGYNGFPRGDEDNPKDYENRELKRRKIVHAETNLIANASMNGVSLVNATIYLSGLPPCNTCTGIIIQCGFSCVVVKQSNMDYVLGNRDVDSKYFITESVDELKKHLTFVVI